MYTQIGYRRVLEVVVAQVCLGDNTKRKTDFRIYFQSSSHVIV